MDFRVDPEFQKKLDWMSTFVRRNRAARFAVSKRKLDVRHQQ